MNSVVGEAIRNAVTASRRLIFDFDGTLVDSNAIKRQAFDLVFVDHPDRMAEIQAYCHGNNHTIRGEKFRYVTEKILGLEYTAAMDRRCHELYARLTTDAVVEAPEVPGAKAFLESVQSYAPVLVSSTPHPILLEILDRRQWKSLFAVIRGAPVDKRKWLDHFRISQGYQGDDLLFFGDTDEDERSALDAGCRFVRVGRRSARGELAIQDFTCF